MSEKELLEKIEKLEKRLEELEKDMATVKPFRGLRPPKNLVEKVESRPYDVLNSQEAREEAGDNEMSL